MAVSKYAIVDGGGNVINIVEWDGVATWIPPAGTVAILSGGGAGDAEIGFSYSGGVFSNGPS